MKKNYLMVVLLLFVLGVASSVQAATVTVADNLADNMLINQGQKVTGTFDINPPVLPADGNYNQPYDVTSAVATFKFTDDGDLALGNSNTMTTYTNWGTSDGTRYQIQSTYNYYVDAYEQVQLNLGIQVSTNGTDWYQMDLADSSYSVNGGTTYHTHSYKCNCDIWGCDTCHTHHSVTTMYNYDTYNSLEGYKGELTIQMQLEPSDLDDLSMDGKVDFTVKGTAGDIIFNQGKLTANVEPNPLPSNVPEPATLFLLALGLTGVAGVIRKRMK